MHPEIIKVKRKIDISQKIPVVLSAGVFESRGHLEDCMRRKP